MVNVWLESTPRTLTAVELLLDDRELVDGRTEQEPARRPDRDVG